MGLFGNKLQKGEVASADLPFSNTISWYWDAFSDERASADDWVSMVFVVDENRSCEIRAWNGFVEKTCTPKGTRPAFKFHTEGRGIRYGDLMDFLEAEAQEDGWEAMRIFRCVYDADENLLSPKYATVEKDPDTPARYIITAEGWTDTGGPWFETPSAGVWGL